MCANIHWEHCELNEYWIELRVHLSCRIPEKTVRQHILAPKLETSETQCDSLHFVMKRNDAEKKQRTNRQNIHR